MSGDASIAPDPAHRGTHGVRTGLERPGERSPDGAAAQLTEAPEDLTIAAQRAMSSLSIAAN